MARKTEAEEKRFISAFMTTWAIHKTGQPSDLVIDAYNKALSEYDIEKIERAFGYAIKSLKWFPKPADLIESINAKSKISIEAAAQQQWRIIRSDLGRGEYDDPITAMLAKRQFSGMRDMLTKDEHWWQKRFCEAYELAAELPKENLQIDIDNKLKRLTAGIG